MEVNYHAVFATAFALGMVGNEVGHRLFRVSRSLNVRLLIGVFSGFVSGLLTFLLMIEIAWNPMALAALVGFGYGCLMAVGRMFRDYG